MKKYSVVIDTNIIVTALRSKNGASYKLISLLSRDLFKINISVPLVLEYESILIRNFEKKLYSKNDLEDFLNYLCAIGNKRKVYFLWRPFLKDPKDDMVLELAVESNSDYIVTYNKKDFSNIKKFGIIALTPIEFIKKLEKKK